MTISVIIPCYNAERYLAPCLQSVLAQDFAEFEVLLIDDGSTDQTAEIAGRYAREDARIRVLRQENKGVSSARNLGLSQARGEWVLFLDGDDLLMPGALRILLSAADEKTDMVVCAHQTFDESGREEIFVPETCWPDKRGEARRQAVVRRLIEGDSVLNIMCNKLHRRALLEREHLRLHPDVRIAEDALFNLEAVLCGRGVSYVPRVTYRYRMHDQSAMHTKAAGSTFEVHLPWLRAMREMLLRRGMLEEYYDAYLDSAALRLYKDGGVAGVMRGFNAKVRPLVLVPGIKKEKMGPYARVLLILSRAGVYPAVYPLIFPIQLARRKADEIRRHLGKERAHAQA